MFIKSIVKNKSSDMSCRNTEIAKKNRSTSVVQTQGRSQKKIERGPNFATFNVTSFTYNGILPFVNYARRYYKNCCTKLRKCECDFTDLM